MGVEPEELETISRVIHKDHRELRNLGNDQPGISFSKTAMRRHGLLDEDGVSTSQEVRVTHVRGGTAVVDFQTD
jgi:hypothetical protein